MHYIATPTILEQAISEYQETSHNERVEFLEDQRREAEQPFDRTFGGIFKSSFPEKEEDE